MGNVIEIRRYLPKDRLAAAADESRERNEARSVRIALWGFLLTAVGLCAMVALALAKTWTELLIFSGILVIFALTKIFLANALFYMMMHYDKDARSQPGPPIPGQAVLPFRQRTPREILAAVTLRPPSSARGNE